jgi:ABC-type transport system involved in multi-copper enzyme maturation permease subunit
MIVAASDAVSRADFYGGVGIMVGAVLVVGSFKEVNVDRARAATLGMYGASIICFGTLAVFESSLVSYWEKHMLEAIIAVLFVLFAVVFALTFTRGPSPDIREARSPNNEAESDKTTAGKKDGI